MLSKSDWAIIGLCGPSVLLGLMILFVQNVTRGRRIWLLLLAAIYAITGVVIPISIFIIHTPHECLYFFLLVLLFRLLELGPGKVIAEWEKYWYLDKNYSTQKENIPAPKEITITLDPEKKMWLRKQLFVIFILCIVSSLMIFIFGGILSFRLRDEINYIAFLAGLCAGIFLGSISFQNPVGYKNMRKSTPINASEADIFLRPIRKEIPRVYYWFANIPYSLFPLILWLLSEKLPPRLPLGLFGIGAGSSYLLCESITNLYLYWKLRKSEE